MNHWKHTQYQRSYYLISFSTEENEVYNIMLHHETQEFN